MTEYIRLLEIVKNKMEIREDSFGSVIAAKIHNNEEFDLMVSYWTAAYSSCCKREKIRGTFVGEDWYFIESQTADYGMDGKSTTYFTQTLTEKKQKFFEFCRKFDADDQPTGDAAPVKHGHWIKIGSQDSIRNMKCSICGEEVFSDVDTEKYCFNCGAKMDEVTE